MCERLFLRDDLVCSKRGGSVKLALVKQVGGVEHSDDSSDSDSDDTTEEVNKGYVRVQWVPSGKNDIVPEGSVEVLDRSFLPRDVVRTKDSQQLGTVLSTSVTCNALVAGTRKILKGVNVSDFLPLMPFGVDDMVSYGPWIGRVQSYKARAILKLTNGSRIAVDFEAFEECDSLVWPKLDVDLDEPYPGQMLSARGKFFKDVEWISGDKINFRMKIWYKMVVEQLEIVSLQIKWGARAFIGDESRDDATEVDAQAVDGSSKHIRESSVDIDEGSYVDAVSDITEDNPATPPPAIIDLDNMKKLRLLNHFWQGHVWVMDKYRYQINAFQASKLNQQKSVTDKKMTKKQLKRRMQKIFQHSTSEESILKSQRKVSSDSESASDSANDKQYGVSTDGDDEDSEYEDLSCDITPSSGVNMSTEVADNGIDIVVTNDSDFSITSPIGRIPTILGTMSCRFAECELDFTLTQKGGSCSKQILLCNIQYPGHSEEMIIEIGNQFQRFMKSALKKNVQIFSTCSPASLMALCPQALRSFVLQQQSIAVTDIFFEYTVDCRRTSGVIDKDGNKREIEFEGDTDDYSGLNQIVLMMDEATDDDKPTTFTTVAFPARQQTGRNIKFLDGQWITVEIRETYTMLKVQWQDGTVQNNIQAKDLFPAHHVDDNDFCPGDFVIDKRVNNDGAHNNRYGVVLKMDNKNRMAQVKWMKSGKPDTVEEVSSYEIADSDEMQFRISDIVARTGDLYIVQPNDEHHAVGELLQVTENGMLQVLWTDGTISLTHPLDVNNVSRGDEDLSIFASSDSEDDGSWTTASSGDADSNSDSEIIGDAQYPDSLNGEDNAAAHEQGRGEGVSQQQDTETSDETDNGSTSLSNEDAQTAVSQFVDEIIELITFQLAKDTTLSNDSSVDSHDQIAIEPSAEEDNITTHDSNTQTNDTASSSLQQGNVNESACAFYMHSSAPETHHFVQRFFDVSSSKHFMKAFQRDLKLLRSSLPSGITVKAYEDRMDLLSVLVEGPSRTPYENGLFAFHIYLSSKYPESPPSVHYISYSPRLNPNLYETGRVCVSLLGTWSGKGNEVWTKESTILQVLLSIQGLILNSEPYYNEAGYEGHRGTAEGAANSRCYNEMVTLRLVQHMASLIVNPPEEFKSEAKQYCMEHIPLLITRVKNMFYQSERMDLDTTTEESLDTNFPLLPLSKGVTLSLQNRLTELQSAFDVMNNT